jgi:hypothetical protein
VSDLITYPDIAWCLGAWMSKGSYPLVCVCVCAPPPLSRPSLSLSRALTP